MVAAAVAEATPDGDGPAIVFGVVAALLMLSSRADIRLVESAMVADGRRTPRLRNSGGATMTIAVSNNARKKRLSIGSDPEAFRL